MFLKRPRECKAWTDEVCLMSASIDFSALTPSLVFKFGKLRLQWCLILKRVSQFSIESLPPCIRYDLHRYVFLYIFLPYIPIVRRFFRIESLLTRTASCFNRTQFNDSFSQSIKRRLDHCNKSKIEIWKFEVRGWIKNHTILTDTFYKKHVAFTLSNSKYEIIEWVKVSYKLVLLLRLSILKYWNNLSFLCHKVSNK